MVCSLDADMVSPKISFAKQPVVPATSPKCSASDIDNAMKTILPSPSLCPTTAPEAPGNRSFNIDDLSSDSDLSDVPEDAGPDPFTSPMPSPTLREDSEYDRDFKSLKTLLACAKKALLTASFSAQVETAAELSLFMSSMEKKWPGIPLGGGIKSEGDPLSLDEDLSSSTDENEDEFLCPYASTYHCDVGFDTSKAAIIHSTVHTATSGEYFCPYTGLYNCTKTFSTLSGARQHGNTVHLKSKPFPCPHATEYGCPKFFSQSRSARVHGYVHTGEKPYPCPYADEYDCSKAFTQSHSAKEHGYIHTGEKPYPCPYAEEYDCPRAFSQLHSAKDHGYLHTGEKPYPCPYADEYNCSKAFAQLHSAKEHGRVHTEEEGFSQVSSTRTLHGSQQMKRMS